MFTSERHDRQMRNFGEMMARLNIDPVDLARDCLGYRLTSAIRRCGACEAGEICRDWLARAPVTIEQAPAFCPNQEIFAAARRKRPEAAPSGSAAA